MKTLRKTRQRPAAQPMDGRSNTAHVTQNARVLFGDQPNESNDNREITRHQRETTGWHNPAGEHFGAPPFHRRNHLDALQNIPERYFIRATKTSEQQREAKTK